MIFTICNLLYDEKKYLDLFKKKKENVVQSGAR